MQNKISCPLCYVPLLIVAFVFLDYHFWDGGLFGGGGFKEPSSLLSEKSEILSDAVALVYEDNQILSEYSPTEIQNLFLQASQDDADSFYEIGSFLFNEKLNSEINKSKQNIALRLFRVSAELGNPEASYKLGRFNYSISNFASYSRKRFFIDKSIYYYKKSARQGGDDALLSLAGIYHYGEGHIVADLRAAMFFFEQAAIRGKVEAKCILGKDFYSAYQGYLLLQESKEEIMQVAYSDALHESLQGGQFSAHLNCKSFLKRLEMLESLESVRRQNILDTSL